ncbi:terpenoid synthase [Apiospora marii]|uniref:terpenoid synthase n=1 Tax=Apiospora marii TaxID=335849 RepID=UPI003131B62B
MSKYSSTHLLIEAEAGMGDFSNEAAVPQATSTSELPPKDLREYIMTQVQGSRVRFPDFQTFLAHWPQGVHPDIDRLEQDVHGILKSIFPNTEDVGRLQRTKAAKLGLFAASWWAYSSYEALRTLLTLCIWLFVWDDETDSGQFSYMINSFSQAAEFRQETLSYLKESLSDGGEPGCSTISTNPIITGFGPVGRSIASWGDRDQVEMFLDELVFFIQMVEVEQRALATPHLPTVDDYMKQRMGTSAVRVFLAIMDDLGNDWPSERHIVLEKRDKRKQAQSQVDTLIPLLFLELGSIQAAIDHGAEMVKASIGRFEAAEENLLARYSDRPNSGRALKDYIDGCKYACTANLNWRQVHVPRIRFR